MEICKKLREKCPLGRKFVKGASSLSPKVMLQPTVAKSRLQVALEELVDAKYISSLESERIRKDYLNFIEDEKVLKKLSAFNGKKQRLDRFFMEIMNDMECCRS